LYRAIIDRSRQNPSACDMKASNVPKIGGSRFTNACKIALKTFSYEYIMTRIYLRVTECKQRRRNTTYLLYIIIIFVKISLQTFCCSHGGRILWQDVNTGGNSPTGGRGLSELARNSRRFRASGRRLDMPLRRT